MNKVKLTALLLVMLLNQTAFAGVIQNGDFSSCDFSGWNKDTDGAGDISVGNDFGIANANGNCQAAIEVDSFAVAGDPFSTAVDDVWFANTLYQELDLSGAAGSTFELSFDLEMRSQSGSFNPSFIADYFLVGLNDGLGNYYDASGALGFLISPTDINGFYQNTFTFELDNSFTNTAGWFLDFQVNVGVDSFGMPDGYGSTLLVNDVSLVEKLANSTDVPEPSTLAIFGLGLLGLVNRKKLSRRKSNHIK